MCMFHHRSGDFHVLIFHVKIFSWSRKPTKYFLTVLNDSTFPGSVIWSKTMHIKKT